MHIYLWSQITPDIITSLIRWKDLIHLSTHPYPWNRSKLDIFWPLSKLRGVADNGEMTPHHSLWHLSSGQSNLLRILQDKYDRVILSRSWPRIKIWGMKAMLLSTKRDNMWANIIIGKKEGKKIFATSTKLFKINGSRTHILIKIPSWKSTAFCVNNCPLMRR